MSAKRPLVAFVERFGEAVSGLLLTVVYFGVLGPFALIVRTFGDPLGLRRGGSAWHSWPAERNSAGPAALARGRRQA